MELQGNDTALGDFESLCQINDDLLHENWVLRLNNKNLSKTKQALEQDVSNLMGLDTKDANTVPETVETETETEMYFEDGTTIDVCEYFRLANTVLTEKNKALRIENDRVSGVIEGLQDKIKELTSQRSCVKATQTVNAWQDMDNAINLLQQEKEAREAENRMLQQEISNLKCEIEEREKQTLQDNVALQTQVQELQTLLQEGKEVSEMNEARTSAYKATLREELEETRAIQSFDELRVEELREEVNVLHECVRDLEANIEISLKSSVCSEQLVLGSESVKLSLWQRFLGYFIPKRSGCLASKETLENAEPVEQAAEEPQRRRMPCERLIQRFRRRT